MYVYFDKDGKLKEIINDEAIRKGDDNYDKIYCYFEGEPRFTGLFITNERPDGVLSLETSIISNEYVGTIPFDKKRDLKYFKYYKEYKFYYYTLSSQELQVNGLAKATVRSVIGGNIIDAYGLITYNIEDNVIKEDHYIMQSQYDYLIELYGANRGRKQIFNNDNVGDYEHEEDDLWISEDN